MEEKQYISRVKLPNNSIFDIKDREARELINLLLFGKEFIIESGGALDTSEEIIEAGNAPIDA